MPCSHFQNRATNVTVTGQKSSRVRSVQVKMACLDWLEVSPLLCRFGAGTSTSTSTNTHPDTNTGACDNKHHPSWCRGFVLPTSKGKQTLKGERPFWVFARRYSARSRRKPGFGRVLAHPLCSQSSQAHTQRTLSLSLSASLSRSTERTVDPSINRLTECFWCSPPIFFHHQRRVHGMSTLQQDEPQQQQQPRLQQHHLTDIHEDEDAVEMSSGGSSSLLKLSTPYLNNGQMSTGMDS